MSIKYAILGLLNYSDMHGYRIKEHIEKNFDYMWAVNFGQIYPNLKDLEKDGFINMFEVAPSEAGGPHKKLYSITEKGIDELSRWLAESPHRPMLIRDSFLLKFAFFGFGEDERAMEIIDEHINRRRWEKQGVYVRLIVELGITQNEMYLEWLRHARAEIEKSLKGAVPGKSLAIL
jgi:DNA-binding PadR family transcriptional regulator